MCQPDRTEIPYPHPDRVRAYRHCSYRRGWQARKYHHARLESKCYQLLLAFQHCKQGGTPYGDVNSYSQAFQRHVTLCHIFVEFVGYSHSHPRAGGNNTNLPANCNVNSAPLDG